MVEMIILMMSWLGLWFHAAGYIFVLRKMAAGLKPPLDQDEGQSLPSIYFVIPTLKEGAGIYRKLLDCSRLHYPADRLAIIVTDGASNDETECEVRRFAESRPDVSVTFIPCPLPGKAQQINEALRLIPSDALVVQTDVDAAISPPSALLTTVKLMTDEVGVVGGWVVPDASKSLRAESAYWDRENRLRWLEYAAGSASIAIGPYLAYRRTLIDAFPQDVCADDIHLSFLAKSKGLQVIYSPLIRATEGRVPQTLRQLFSGKWRKAHAYSRELWRFNAAMGAARPVSKFLFVFKQFQMFFLPWFALAFVGCCIVLFGRAEFKIPAMLSGLLLLSMPVASRMLLAPDDARRLSHRGLRPLEFFSYFAIIATVLVLNSVSFALRKGKPYWEKTGS